MKAIELLCDMKFPLKFPWNLFGKQTLKKGTLIMWNEKTNYYEYMLKSGSIFTIAE